MNYDGSQQYGLNLGLAAAAAAAGSQPQASLAQNVGTSIYPYAFSAPGDTLQHHGLSAKLASVPIQAAPLPTMAGKNIIYTPQTHILQQQMQMQQQQQQMQLHQQQLQQQHLLQHQPGGAATFSMIQGPALVGRPGVFPMVTGGLSVAQDQLCSPQQAVVDVYGNLSPNMVTQKITGNAAGGYKNVTSWMNLPPNLANTSISNNNNSNSSNNNNSIMVNSNCGTGININTNTTTNQQQQHHQQATLPSIGQLLSHFQQQKQQTAAAAAAAAAATFIQPVSQPMVRQQQQQNLASIQGVHLLQGPPTASLQVSPGGVHLSPGGVQLSPGGQTLQNTLSPGAVAPGVNLSSVRQVHVSGAVGPMIGGALRSQVVMAPRGQLIMTQTIPSGAAVNYGGGVGMGKVSMGTVLGVNILTQGSSGQHCDSAPVMVSNVGSLLSSAVSTASAPLPAAASTTTTGAKATCADNASNNKPSPETVRVAAAASSSNGSQHPVTSTTVTVTTSACSLATTTATTVHASIPLTTSISVLPPITVSSCGHAPMHHLSPNTGGQGTSSQVPVHLSPGRGQHLSLSSGQGFAGQVPVHLSPPGGGQHFCGAGHAAAAPMHLSPGGGSQNSADSAVAPMHLSPGGGSQNSADSAEGKEESGRGSMSVSPSTPSTAASASSSAMSSMHDSLSSAGDCGGKMAESVMTTVKVPYSWRRVVENGAVFYFSPSNICLASCEEIRTYLTQSNTCKCGLECPLVVEQTFNFDPGVEGRSWSLVGEVTCSGDLTKLCSHKRKVLALATFQSSASVAGHESLPSSRADGPPAKCRKREKSRHNDDLLVSPLVVDSKLKTSITNAVNKHATSSHTNTNTNSAAQHSPSTDTVTVKQEPGRAGGGGGAQAGSKPFTPTPTPISCVVEGSLGTSYLPPSPMSHSPGSMRSTGSVGSTTADIPDNSAGVGPPHFVAAPVGTKLEFGVRNHSFGGAGVRMGVGGMTVGPLDPRHFAPGGMHCGVMSPEDLKQSYFIQQSGPPPQAPGPAQQLPPLPHPQGTAGGMTFVGPNHAFRGPGPRPLNHLGPVQSSQFLGFNPPPPPHGPQAGSYGQHGYGPGALVYPMTMGQPPGHSPNPHHPSLPPPHHLQPPPPTPCSTTCV